MRMAPGPKVRAEGDEFADAEVPAAVVCAHCGDADCPGCTHEQTRSGVVAVVPWERPGTSTFARLWATARATTFDAERFFESLPDGPITPAFRFAVASELIASASMSLVIAVPVLVFAPGWVRHLLLHETATAVRFATAGIPGWRRSWSRRTPLTGGRSTEVREEPALARPRVARSALVCMRRAGIW